MWVILMAAIALLIVSVGLLGATANSTSLPLIVEMVADFSAVALGFLGVVTLVLLCFNGFGWLAAEQKAKVLNREYGTNYTQQEVFYASSVIDTVRELDRKRVEINGDVLGGGKK